MQKGQSLIEILIGVTIGAILLGSAVGLIGVVLRTNVENKFVQTATFLSSDLMSKVKVYAAQKWYCTDTVDCGIYNLSKGSGNHYHLVPAPGGGGFTFVATDEINIIVDGASYTRYFYVENVSRELGGDIAETGGVDDPSTQKVTAVTMWPSGGEVEIVEHITRGGNRTYIQTDWSGGVSTPDPPLLEPGNTYSNAVNVDFGVKGEFTILP